MPASAIARLITAAALALCAAVAHAAALCDPNHLNEQACLEQANQGNAQAQRTLAYIYYRGAGGVAQNRQKGVQWMQRAAENGDAAAQYNLGLMYLAGIYRYEADRRLPVFSILTRAPAPEIAFIHDRMPVIFSEANCRAWLDGAPVNLV